MRGLDLFCKAGGASVGYAELGIEMEGVDTQPQPNYPFKFYLRDALTFPLNGYDFVHASPPCQDYSITKSIAHEGPRRVYPRLITLIRERCLAAGVPFVIENVVGARPEMIEPIQLCGAMFTPPPHVYRHRLFETSFPCPQPEHPKHEHYIGSHKLAIYQTDPEAWVTVAGHLFSKAAGSAAMNIDWMTRAELAEALPREYTRYVGTHLLRAVHG